MVAYQHIKTDYMVCNSCKFLINQVLTSSYMNTKIDQIINARMAFDLHQR